MLLLYIHDKRWIWYSRSGSWITYKFWTSLLLSVVLVLCLLLCQVPQAITLKHLHFCHERVHPVRQHRRKYNGWLKAKAANWCSVWCRLVLDGMHTDSFFCYLWMVDMLIPHRWRDIQDQSSLHNVGTYLWCTISISKPCTTVHCASQLCERVLKLS